jgi:hypothetical protein
VLRHRGAETQANLLTACAAELRAALAASATELLSLDQAAARSGYSKDHLGRLVREGKIPDQRPPGTRGRLAIRAHDLPRKPARSDNGRADVHDLASRLYRGKEGHHGHS